MDSGTLNSMMTARAYQLSIHPLGDFVGFAFPSDFAQLQRRLNHTLEGLKGVRTIHNDILVFGEGSTQDEALEDYNQNLRSLMQRCREQNVKLNKAKVKLRCGELPFLGHLITKDDLKGDPAKIRAVLEMPTPTDVASVCQFIGFTNYLSTFLPRLSDV